MKTPRMLLAALVVTGLAAGCASNGALKAHEARVAEGMNILRTELAGVREDVGKRALAADVEAVKTALGTKAEQSFMAAELAKKAEKPAIEAALAAKADAKKMDEALAAKADRADLESQIGTLRINFEERARKLAGGIAAVRKNTQKTAERAGGVDFQAERNLPESQFLVKGFPACRYDEVKAEVIANAPASLKDAVKTAKEKAEKLGRTSVSVFGFADERPFRDKTGKVRSDSDKLNARCAELRADRVAGVLKELGLAAASVAGQGTSTRFGEYNANRGVALVFTKTLQPIASGPAVTVPPVPAPAPPAAAPSSTPAPGASKPVSPAP